MKKKLRFFWKTSGDDAPAGFDCFVRDDCTVWRDNYRTCESQCAAVGFDDFAMPCPELDWEVIEAPNAD